MAKLKKKTQLKKVKAKKKVAKKKAVVRKKTAKRAQTVKRTSAQKAATASTVATMVGRPVPDFVLPSTGGKNLSFKDFSGKNVVLYFYPKDDTPGCTLEGYDFRRMNREFEGENTVILGASKDSVKSHENFRAKCEFPFDLIADEHEKLCRAFDVIQMKSMYGRKYEGIERSTFVIDGHGRVVKEWRKVKVDGHAQEVLNFIKSLART